MREQLLRTFDESEAVRLQLLARLDKLPADALTRKPSPDAWSVVEVIVHLIKAENGTLSYLRKKLELGGHRKASPMAAMRKSFLNFMIGLPIKFKAPRIVQLEKGIEMPYAEARAQWDEVRAALRKEYETIDSVLITHDLFKHPFAGKLNLLQSMSFMHHHMVRHIGQIEHTLSAVGA
jgi:uncharacterized damage-inducible protein DinB